MSHKMPRSWFEDDPEWEILRRKAENKPIPKALKDQLRPEKIKRETPRAQVGKQSSDEEVVVNLKLAIPKVKLPKPADIYSRHKRQILKVAGVAVCLLLVFGSIKAIGAFRAERQEGKVASAEDQAAQSFNPLVPLDNLTDDSGKKTKEPDYAYDDKKNVLGYSTEYNGAILTLSQQALPEKVKTNPGELAYIGKSVGAVDPLQTQKGTAFVGEDTTGKLQTAVFATDEVLVFIRTNKKLDSEEWKFYINQLTPRE